MMRSIAAVAITAALLCGCTAQQSANLQAAAVTTCSAAEIAASATVTITADINSSAQTQKDAATALKVTTDACTALQKLPTIIAATAPAATN